MRNNPSERNIIAALQAVDWNFTGATTMRNTVHTLHWFPGNFIPEIPAYLIQILSDEGEIVLDPFCGSGTTGIEALRLRRTAWQSDVNRASIEVARGKLAVCAGSSLVPKLTAFVNSEALGSLFRPSAGSVSEHPHVDARKWFHADTYADLRYLWHQIDVLPRSRLKQVLQMVFSDTLFACASTSGVATSGGGRRRHHWGWIADNVVPSKPVRHDANRLFRERVIRAITAIQSNPPSSSRASVLLRQDARQLAIRDESVDLVVTSPPYLGMIDYTLASRVEYLWMGWSLEADKTREIGPRFRRNRSNTVDEYLAAMCTSAFEIARVLRGGRYCAIVIGASRKFPDVTQEVITRFSKFLRVIWGPSKRIPTRRRISERKGTEPLEMICVFRK